jgi:hypothetical protein
MRAVVLVLLFTGCSGVPPKDLPVATEACLVGWWHGPSSTCDFGCPGQPECTATDCELVDYVAFLQDKSTLSGNITLSRSMKKFSSLGPRDQGVWSLEAGGALRLRADGGTVDAQCEGPRLDLGLATQERYDQPLASALDRLRSVASFQSESY